MLSSFLRSTSQTLLHQKPSFGVFRFTRLYATSDISPVDKLRNIGISAHIDSGKTTLTERILYYTGKIKDIHEVRGKDGVGAKMDSMDLEREKGITIQSAATFANWKGTAINIIDTPGHVDFTVEVERALRVLDGAVLVLCSVGGVQSQTLTVDRQMKRYSVPALAFINKLDRTGADHYKIIEQIKTKLKRNPVLMQIPIGLEDNLKGTVDLVTMKAIYSEGAKGEILKIEEIPEDLLELAQEKRLDLIAALADFDDEVGELFVMEEDPPVDVLKRAMRKCTLEHKITPVFLGSALKNNGVQLMLDGVIDYLPKPTEVENYALNAKNEDEKIFVKCDNPDLPFVAYAFKLEEGKFGQLTYFRIYQGTLRKGMFMRNVNGDVRKKIKVPRLVRMHSDEMEDVDEVGPGEICAVFGMECSSGDTFVSEDAAQHLTMSSMFVPEPVMSLAIRPSNSKEHEKLIKALNRFKREDPTFRLHVDRESNETIISGMGELHLEIYVERIKREYGCDVKTDKPKVNFRETLAGPVKFDYLHKKQSGGSGQYGKVIGEIRPLSFDQDNEFTNSTVGMNIPPEFMTSIEKGFHETCMKGFLTGNQVVGLEFVLKDGAAHVVDSNDAAFKAATRGALKQCFDNGKPILLEPIMNVEVNVPEEFQGNVGTMIGKRAGLITNSENDVDWCCFNAEVPLNNMFGFANDLRSATQGKGEFSMEYHKLARAVNEVQEREVANYQKSRGQKS